MQQIRHESGVSFMKSEDKHMVIKLCKTEIQKDKHFVA